MTIFGRLTKQQTQALNFFADRLFSRQMQKHLEIEFVFRKTMPDYYGVTYINDFNEGNKLRNFVIEIDSGLNRKEKIITMAHELVHVKQFAYGHMDECMSRWRGKKIDLNSVPYVEQPWEIEATETSEKLFLEFMENRHGNS